MNKEDKDWLKTVFPQYMRQVIRGVNKDAYEKAERLITGKVTMPDCSCSYTAHQNKINVIYEEWLKINT